MVDIFISYKREERDKAKALAEAFSVFGYSVWWDVDLLPGHRFAQEIESVIQKSKIVLVLWSSLSVNSDWVKQEAQEARALGKLFPISLDGVQPPFGFKDLQSYDLTDWLLDSNDSKIEKLVQQVQQIIGPPLVVESKENVPSEPLKQFNREAEYWRTVSSARHQNAAEYESYLEMFGMNAQFADIARARITQLQPNKMTSIFRFGTKHAVTSLTAAAAIVTILIGVRQFTNQPPLSDQTHFLNETQSSQDIETLSKSVVMVSCLNDKKSLWQASGVVVRKPGLILSDIATKTLDPGVRCFLGSFTDNFDLASAVELQILMDSRDDSFTILQAEESSKFPMVQLAVDISDRAEMRLGDRVVMLGYKRNQLVTKYGRLTFIPQNEEQLIRIDTGAVDGMSGGPVFLEETGELLGTAISIDADFRGNVAGTNVLPIQRVLEQATDIFE